MKRQVSVTLEEGLLRQLDALVEQEKFESRSAAVECAIEALHRQLSDEQFERALAELTDEDVAEMQAMSEEGIGDWCEMLAGNEW